ncbi:uncharacterized protein LOC101856708 [Aplysia californica]|uniref:Uncharacterized protein LOC101856708 n=1 Tax=Aplysia californica TaxID=6500 RepID=A0ABM1ADT9_APLCA|nr:uncharacterized protein LOC101856708 [Aplysia californica]
MCDNMEQRGRLGRFLQAVNCTLDDTCQGNCRLSDTYGGQEPETRPRQNRISVPPEIGTGSATEQGTKNGASCDSRKLEMDWLDGLDPREEFIAALCPDCEARVAVTARGKDPVYPSVVIRKEVRENDTLISLLLDGVCPCDFTRQEGGACLRDVARDQERSKVKVKVTPLDVIATLGDVDLLVLCIQRMSLTDNNYNKRFCHGFSSQTSEPVDNATSCLSLKTVNTCDCLCQDNNNDKNFNETCENCDGELQWAESSMRDQSSDSSVTSLEAQKLEENDAQNQLRTLSSLDLSIVSANGHDADPSLSCAKKRKRCNDTVSRHLLSDNRDGEIAKDSKEQEGDDASIDGCLDRDSNGYAVNTDGYFEGCAASTDGYLNGCAVNRHGISDGYTANRDGSSVTPIGKTVGLVCPSVTTLSEQLEHDASLDSAQEGCVCSGKLGSFSGGGERDGGSLSINDVDMEEEEREGSGGKEGGDGGGREGERGAKEVDGRDENGEQLRERGEKEGEEEEGERGAKGVNPDERGGNVEQIGGGGEKEGEEEDGERRDNGERLGERDGVGGRGGVGESGEEDGDGYLEREETTVLIDNALTQDQIDVLRTRVKAESLVSCVLHSIEHHNPHMLASVLALPRCHVMSVLAFCRDRGRYHSMIHALTLLSVHGGWDWEDRCDVMDQLNMADYVSLRRFEQAEASYLAWYNPHCVHGRLEHLVGVALQPLVVELCKDCLRSLFPNTFIMCGHTVAVKFHRRLHDNEAITDTLVAGSCSTPHPWPTGSPPRKVSIVPACSAATVGNVQLLARIIPGLVGEGKGHGVKRSSLPLKGCLRRCEKIRPKNLTFRPVLTESCGETLEGELIVHAIYSGSDECVKLLLSSKAAGAVTSRDILSCLDMALRMGRDDLFMRIVFRYGCHVKSWDHEEATPLMLATRFGRPLLVQMLLSMGADPEVRNSVGKTAVHMAVDSDDQDSDFLARMMLSRCREMDPDTTLMKKAMVKGKLSIVGFLVDHGVSGVFRDHPYHRPAKREGEEEKLSLVDAALNSTPNSNVAVVLKYLIVEKHQDVGNPSSLYVHKAVCKRCSVEVINILIRHGAPVNVYDSAGISPLYLALHCGPKNHIAPLLKAGASIRCLSPAGHFSTAMMDAVKRRETDVIQLLLHCGYRCTEEDRQKLHAAQRLADYAVVSISDLLSQPMPLVSLCAVSLREGLGDQLNTYLDHVRCPAIFKDFIHCKHLVERFL